MSAQTSPHGHPADESTPLPARGLRLRFLARLAIQAFQWFGNITGLFLQIDELRRLGASPTFLEAWEHGRTLGAIPAAPKFHPYNSASPDPLDTFDWSFGHGWIHLPDTKIVPPPVPAPFHPVWNCLWTAHQNRVLRPAKDLPAKRLCYFPVLPA